MAGEQRNRAARGGAGLVMHVFLRISRRLSSRTALVVTIIGGFLAPVVPPVAQETADQGRPVTIEPAPPAPDDTPGTPGAEPSIEAIRPIGGDRRRVERGETVTIAFSFPRNDPADVTLYLPELPEGLERREGAVVVTRGLRAMEVRVPLVAAVAGRWVLDPIRVEAPSTIAETHPVLIEVETPGTGVVPFRARWTAPDRFRQGQSVPVVLEITGIDAYAFPEAVSIRAPESGLFEEVGGLGSVSSREIGGVTLYRIPVAGFIFTPSAPGTVTIPAAGIRAAGMEVRALPRSVTVEPLPERVQDTGAVGSFDIAADLEPKVIPAGGTATVTIEIAGSGNLPVLEFPSIDLEGFVEIDRSRISEVEPDRDGVTGYTGMRRLQIRVEALDGPEEGSVTVAQFPVWNAREEVVELLPSMRLTADLVPSDAEAPVERTPPEAALIDVDDLARLHWVPISEARWLFFVFLLGPLVFAVVKLVSVRGAAVVVVTLPLLLGATIVPRIDGERLARAAAIAAEGRPAVAAVMYELELQEHDWHPGLHFNRGVLAMRSGDAVQAVFHLRSAVRLAPERGDFRSVLAATQQYFETVEQPAIPWYPHPDYFAVAVFGIWTLLWLVLSARGRTRRAVGLVVLVVLGTVVSAGWLWAGVQADVTEAVIVEDVTVRRIPDGTAQPWLQAAAATAVTVELSYEDFYLVRTAAGVTGWVPGNSLWIQGRD